jgi:hypothetical protein
VTFFYKVTMKKTRKNQRMRVQWLLSAAILAQWWCPVASTKALDLLHRVIHMVWYQRIVVAIKMASKVSQFIFVVSFAVALAAAGAIWSE